MSIEQAIRAVRSLADLPQLVAGLGHAPLWERVPREGWNRPTRGGFTVMAVGKTGSVPWFAIESRTPERSAASLARRLSRRGRISIVLALDPDARRLAFATALDKPARLEIALDQPGAESLASIARLAGRPEGGPLAFAVQAADALSAEPAGRRFFREFRFTLERVAAGLPGPMRSDDRHALALLQLTRVLFLYFIQAKGWLAGRDRFLAEEVDRCLMRGRRIHQDLLRPLFFGTLNQIPSQRSRMATSFGAIPFLNGGLFEPHPLERRFRANIPNQLWRQAFDRLYERFHFTVVEGSSGSIAPDMLGRMFEGVMEPDLRRASGTFYTPASLVKQVVDTALVALISGRLGCSEALAERQLEDAGGSSVAEVLRGVTVLDPAVGSGAFLLGTLERLASIASEPAVAVARKRAVLRRNLFGVDLNPTAVRLAELRLWLAVVADDRTERPQDIRPLPNLDCLIRQGDSLFDPIGQITIDRPQSDKHRRELTGLRRQVVTATGPTKRALVRRLRALEAEALDHSLGWAETQYRSEITAALFQARGGDLFGRRRGLDLSGRKAVVRLRRELHQIRQARRRLAREGGLPWFHYQSHFADVFANGGFDLVVGNPPWLRSEQIPPGVRRRLAGRYHWCRGGSQRYGKGPDMSVAFLERGLELLAPSGVLAMLVPAKITSAGYGVPARHSLASTVTLHAVADLTTELRSQFDALVYPMAIVAGKVPPSRDHRVRLHLKVEHGASIPQSELRGGQPWILVGNRLRDALAELKGSHPRLGDTLVAHLGVKTGANHLYLNPPVELEPALLRPAIRGRDIRPFLCRVGAKLLWTHDEQGQPLATLPARAAAYLSAHLMELRSRKDYKSGAPWTLFRVLPSLARYRVVWADLASQVTAAALTTQRDRRLIPLNSCYVAPTARRLTAECLCAWLNSSWIRAAARLGAVPAANGFARFNAQTLARLPLPNGVLSDPELGRIARAGRAGRTSQEELDTIVSRHLGLSAATQSAFRNFIGTDNSR